MCAAQLLLEETRAMVPNSGAFRMLELAVGVDIPSDSRLTGSEPETRTLFRQNAFKFKNSVSYIIWTDVNRWLIKSRVKLSGHSWRNKNHPFCVRRGSSKWASCKKMNAALCISRNLNEIQVASESLLDLHIFADVADVVVVTDIVVGAVGTQAFV